MTDTTAKIRAKGLNETGVTEQVARSYYDQLGTHHLAIVEYTVESRTIDCDGHQKVDLVLTQVEPVVDGGLTGQLDDHIREIQRALYRNRKLAEDGEQLPLDGDDPEPTIRDVLTQGHALLDRDTGGGPVLWDGSTDAADVPDEPQLAGPDTGDPSYDMHTFLPDPNDARRCAIEGCGKTTRAAIHHTAHAFSN